MHGARGPRATAGDGGTERKAGQWQGNVLLLVAIGLLVGVATFVMVRERLADQGSAAPARSTVDR